MLRIINTATRLALLSWLAGAALPETASAQAADDIDYATRQVSTAGLNLANPADQKTLRHRLVVAAHNVCFDVTGGPTLDGDYQRCVTQAFHDAWADAAARIAAARGTALVAN